MNMFKCTTCKNLFLEADVIKNARLVYKGKVYQYYLCNGCNNARHRIYRRTKSGSVTVRKAIKRSENKYPGKQRARGKLNKYIFLGKIKKPEKCTLCLKIKKLDGHHTDYSKPLDVVWLCRKCHIGLHKIKGCVL